MVSRWNLSSDMKNEPTGIQKISLASKILVLLTLWHIGANAADIGTKLLFAYEAKGGKFNQSYRIELFSDGIIRYSGISNVKTIGRHDTRISSDQVQTILKQLEKMGIDKYTPAVRGPVIETSIRANLIMHAGGIDKELDLLQQWNADFIFRALAIVETVMPTETLGVS